MTLELPQGRNANAVVVRGAVADGEASRGEAHNCLKALNFIFSADFIEIFNGDLIDLTIFTSSSNKLTAEAQRTLRLRREENSYVLKSHKGNALT